MIICIIGGEKMALILTILAVIAIGVIAIFIHKKENIGKIIVPCLILFASDFLFLCGKFAAGDDFLTVILYLPAGILLLISVIWLGVILIKCIIKKTSRRTILTISFCFIITAIIVSRPALKSNDKLKLYQKDYYTVANAIFQAYDEEKISLGDEFSSNDLDLDKINSIFPNNIVKDMKKLSRYAGVYVYAVSEKDVIYFYFASAGPISSPRYDGVVVCRNGQEPTRDKKFSENYIHIYIVDGGFHYHDGSKV